MNNRFILAAFLVCLALIGDVTSIEASNRDETAAKVSDAQKALAQPFTLDALSSHGLNKQATPLKPLDHRSNRRQPLNEASPDALRKGQDQSTGFQRLYVLLSP